MAPKIIESVYPESKLFGFTRCDGTVHFMQRVHALLKSNDVVLDVGCGRGVRVEDPCQVRREMQDLRGAGRKVIGIDVDANGIQHPWLDEFRQIVDINRWPVEDNSVDLIYSDYVLEHVQDPPAFFREAHRVLKAGGCICLRTPNAYSCISIATWLIPNRLHARIVSWLKPGVEDRDVFPTVYRCNTRRRLLRTLKDQGFNPFVYPIEGEPSYFESFPLLYRLGAWVNPRFPGMFQANLLAFGQKLD